MKTALALIALAFAAWAAPEPVEMSNYRVIEKPNTVIIRRNSESIVMTKAAYRRAYLQDWPDISPEHLSAVLRHCEQPIAHLVFTMRDYEREFPSAVRSRSQQGEKG